MSSVVQAQSPAFPDMSDHQLLSNLLSLAGHSSHDARELSHALLDSREKDLARVFAMSPQELLEFPGLGDEAASFLTLIPTVVERYLETGHSPLSPAQPLVMDDLFRFLAPEPAKAEEEQQERVCIFCLGYDLELLTAVLLAKGGPAEVSCSVPRLLDLALTHRAKSVILAHSHPDGSTVFSKDDLLSTRIVGRALNTVDILLADHLLLAGGVVVSLRELFYSGKITDLPFCPPRLWGETSSSFYRSIVRR